MGNEGLPFLPFHSHSMCKYKKYHNDIICSVYVTNSSNKTNLTFRLIDFDWLKIHIFRHLNILCGVLNKHYLMSF